MKRIGQVLLVLALMLATFSLCAADSLVLRQTVGDLAGRTLSIPGETTFTYPDGPKGWWQRGLRVEHDGASDWRDFYGLQLEFELSDERPVELTVKLSIPEQQARDSYVPSTQTTVAVGGRGLHRVTLPWSAFDFQQAQPAFLKFVREVRLTVRPVAAVEATPRRSSVAATPPPARAATTWLRLKRVDVVRGEKVSLTAEVRGKATSRGGTVEYRATVGNCTDQPQVITLVQERYGWEAMKVAIEPQRLELRPMQTAEVVVRVEVPATIPPGGHEKQTIKAIANGDAATAASVTFITASELPHPHILHTPDRWQEVRDKVAKYDWAKKARDEYVARAARWNVPEVAQAPRNLTGVDNMGPFLFRTQEEHDLMAAGIAYQLTGEAKHAEKVRTFLLRLSDPKDGYPVTLRGCNQSLVQEGHFFQHIAMAYDMALSSGIFSDADKAQIERSFRLYIGTIDFEAGLGAINNWIISEIVGALYCTLAMQDMDVAERYFRGSSGVMEQLAKGTLDDGWWYECSISYNVWCATEFSQVALAMEPWGVNFRDMKLPTAYSPNYSLRPWEMVDGLYGMSFQKWGPVTKPCVNIKRMWDALPQFSDYRGVMFAVNDATERRLTGEAYEIAYYLYRDPAYATLIKQGGAKRDLLYGVPELPAETPEKFRDSAYADNVGVVMLRSQTENRPIREQIQAVLHYGTHGGFHGHFDRTSLLHLSRYGRSFYNPEMIWYSYAPYMYKFYVQNSTSKNMVVVDRKMQEPVESWRLLYHSGQAMQATVVETQARWSTPPYGGMVYPEQGYKTFAEKAFGEGRSLPIPDNPPEYGSVTEFTEPVLQRRAMIVTDDYVVLADYLKGEREHVFESLLQMKGFKGIESANKRFVRHDVQWDTNQVLDAQFVTDCDWYSVSAPAKAGFEMQWGPGADNAGTRALESEDGVLKLDVHTLWPLQQEIMVGAAPEEHPVEKRLFYRVRGDGKTLADGKFGAWILGSADIDVPLEGVKQLELETRVEISKRPTVFWANARIVTKDGKEIPLNDLPVKLENIEQPKEPWKDYFGGPIKIVGMEYKSATPAQPLKNDEKAFVRVDLSGVNAARFKATLGGDYPLGDETQRRKTYSVRVQGKSARFLTIIEPHEAKPVVQRTVATSADSLRVELLDGRVQEISLKNFEGSGKDIVMEIIESKDGQVLRRETTVQNNSRISGKRMEANE